MSKSDRADEATRLVASLDPAPQSQVEAGVGEKERQAAHDRALAAAERSGPAEHRRRRRLLWGTASLAALGTAAIVVVALTGGGSGEIRDGDRGGGGPKFAQAAIRVAEANPRYLITAPGWSVRNAYAFEEDQGSIFFANGDRKLELTWYPARLYRSYREDRAQEEGPDLPIEIAGVEGTMIHYGDEDYAAMLPPQGELFVEIRGEVGTESDFRKVVSTLEQTDVETWLSAMPPRIVQPREQRQIVDSLLMGVPLPPNFDLRSLRSDLSLDRDALIIRVATEVACGWLDSWASARKTGDRAAMERAVEAMATAGDWPALQRRPVVRHQAQTIKEYARSIAKGKLDQSFGGATVVKPDGRAFAYGPAYALVLECDSIERREVDPPG